VACHWDRGDRELFREECCLGTIAGLFRQVGAALEEGGLPRDLGDRGADALFFVRGCFGKRVAYYETGGSRRGSRIGGNHSYKPPGAP